MVKESSYSHIVRCTSLFGGIQGLTLLVGLVRNKLVAMLLGTQGFGLISIFNSTIALLNNGTNLGLPMSAVKHISEAYDRGDSEQMRDYIRVMRSWCLITALLGMVLCVTLSPIFNKVSFSWGNHTLHFAMLFPAVGLIAITGGETAILKGTRQLRRLAQVSIYNVLAALVLTVPMFYVWGNSAIVPSLVIMALAQMLLTIGVSYRSHAPEFSFSKACLSKGTPMVKLGVAFISAGILGSGAEFIIRSYLNVAGSLETLGLYNAGYMVTMACSSVLFSSMEADYFPRLSSVNDRSFTLSRTVNSQIEVSLLLVAPIIVGEIIFLPVLVRLLYNSTFLPAVGMMQIAAMALFIRAMRLPIEYIPLAKGDSNSYFTLEAVYDIMLVVFMLGAFSIWGIIGTGVAMAVAGFANMFVVVAYAYRKYGFRLSSTVMFYAMAQLPFCFGALLCALMISGWGYWLLGSIIIMCSALVSISILRTKDNLWNKLKSKLLKR